MLNRISIILAVALLIGCPEKKKDPVPPPVKPSGPVLIEVRGDVTQGGTLLATGDTIALDQDIIVKEGRATIELPDGATLRLYADTRLRLPQKHRVRLFLGKVWALIAPRFEDQFEVETTNAVAGVRGTQLIVEASEKRTRVAVLTGEVEVANLKKRTAKKRVTKGQEVVVEAEEPPTEPAVFEPKVEEQAWEKLGELKEIVPEPAEPETTEESDASEPGKLKPRKRRPKNQLEREGDETKRRLIEEGKRKERELKKESAETKGKLKKEEADIRRKIKEDEKRAKEGGSVKDFLD